MTPVLAERLRGTKALRDAPIVESLREAVAVLQKSPLSGESDRYYGLAVSMSGVLAELAIKSADWGDEGIVETWMQHLRRAGTKEEGEEKLPRIALVQQRALASWGYWALSKEGSGDAVRGKTFKDLSDAMSMGAQTMHSMYVPLKCTMPCPRCSSEASFAVTSVRNTPGCLSCSCTSCGHEDAIGFVEDKTAFASAVRMRCACASCEGDRTSFLAKARDTGSGLVASVAAWLARSSADLEQGPGYLPYEYTYSSGGAAALARSVFRTMDVDAAAVSSAKLVLDEMPIVRYSEQLEALGLNEGWLVLEDAGRLVEEAVVRQEVVEALQSISERAGSMSSRIPFDQLMSDGSDSVVFGCVEDLMALHRHHRLSLKDGWSYGLLRMPLGRIGLDSVAYVFAGHGDGTRNKWASKAVGSLSTLVSERRLADRLDEVRAALTPATVERYLSETAQKMELQHPGATRLLDDLVAAGLPAKPPKLVSLFGAEVATLSRAFLYWKYCAPINGRSKPTIGATKFSAMTTGLERRNTSEGGLKVSFACGRCGQEAELNLRDADCLKETGYRSYVHGEVTCSHCGHTDNGLSFRQEDEWCKCNACLAEGSRHPAEVAAFRAKFFVEMAQHVRQQLVATRRLGPVSRAYGLDRRLHGVNYQGAASAETLQKVSKAVAGSSSPDIAAVILACLSSHDEMEDGCIQMGVLARLMEAGLIEVDTEIPALSLTDDQLILHVLQRLGSPRQLIGPLLCDDEVPAQVLLNAAVELANKVETFPYVVVHRLSRPNRGEATAGAERDAVSEGQAEEAAPALIARQAIECDSLLGPLPVEGTDQREVAQGLAVRDAIALLRSHGFMVVRKPRRAY